MVMKKIRRSVWLFAVLVVGAVLLTACGSGKDSKSSGDTNTQATTETNATPTSEPVAGEYRTLSIDEFADIVENHADDYEIINVHIPYAGEVANTGAKIPYNDLGALMAAIPDKNTPVILYCRSGNMSQQASTALIRQGYTQVWDVPGGMIAWQSSGRALLDK
jgi:rhodanese-related sulfurtransferase/predicted small secreted protein